MKKSFCLLVTHTDKYGRISKVGFVRNEKDILSRMSEENGYNDTRVFSIDFRGMDTSREASPVVEAEIEDKMGHYLGDGNICDLKIIHDYLRGKGLPDKVSLKFYLRDRFDDPADANGFHGDWTMQSFADAEDAQSYFDRQFHDPRKPFGKKIREAVYAKCEGHCAYCGKAITIRQMQVDHVKSFTMGGSSEITNLMPSCVLCNRCKGGDTLEWFRKYIENDAPRIHFGRKHPIDADADRICEAYGLHPGKNEIKFYFEKPVIPTK